MRHYSLNQILKLPRLHNLLYSSDHVFSPQNMITELGLYDSVLIDVSDIASFSTKGTDTPTSRGYPQHINNIEVSKDVKALHEFIKFNSSVMLPCPECRMTMAYSSEIASNPQKSEPLLKVETASNNGIPQYVPTVSGIPDTETRRRNVFDPVSPEYVPCRNEMIWYENSSNNSIDYDAGITSCIEGILNNICEIRKNFVCSYNHSHRLFIDCIIYRAIDLCKEKNTQDDYDKIKYYLILEKVGQEPSMADLQMFDIEKYRNILSKERFRDFSMALGLSASGVGCGSLLYLRRVFESVIIMVQEECCKLPNWDSKTYENLRFNEKIDCLETFGKKIIPDELSNVRSKIYGKLSQGVHELSEQEANELFPLLKYAIEVILDHQIYEKEKSEKIKQLEKKINC